MTPGQAMTSEQLTPKAGQAMLEQLPERIRQALINRAAELGYPVEAILEMALAGYLDSDAIAVPDCKPNRGQAA